MKAKIFSKEEIENFSILYNNGHTLSEIGKMYSTTRHMISKQLKNNGINVSNGRFERKYDYDRKFFKTIDTEEKAYILGFIFADGNITKDNIFQLCLSEIDVDILEKINKAMNSSYPIYNRAAHGGYENSKPQKYIRITSKELYNDLYNLGMKDKESAKENVPKHLFHHFIRGVFDGDGTISKNNRGNECEFYIMGNEKLLLEFTDFFEEQGVLMNGPKMTRNIFKIRKNGPSNIRKIYNILYKDANIYLERKHEKWGKIINEFI